MCKPRCNGDPWEDVITEIMSTSSSLQGLSQGQYPTEENTGLTEDQVEVLKHTMEHLSASLQCARDAQSEMFRVERMAHDQLIEWVKLRVKDKEYKEAQYTRAKKARQKLKLRLVYCLCSAVQILDCIVEIATFHKFHPDLHFRLILSDWMDRMEHEGSW